jgi:hypothetical protein
VNEAELKLCCVIAYLDEREALVHPIARVPEQPALRPVFGVFAGQMGAAPQEAPAPPPSGEEHESNRQALTAFRSECEELARGGEGPFHLYLVRTIAGIIRDLKHELAESQSLLVAAISQRDEAQAELARVKGENERLEAEVAAVRRVLSGETSKEQAAHNATKLELAAVRNELTWERGWDLLRKAQMQAVVDAARKVDAYFAPSHCEETGALRRALLALDQPRQPEPASEARAVMLGNVELRSFATQAEAEAHLASGECKNDEILQEMIARGRPILVGSKWRNTNTGHVRTVTRVEPKEVFWIDGSGYSDQWWRELFLAKHEWLSDPSVETPEGEAK